MHKMSDNYYLRNYYFESNKVPTQSMIKNKMTQKLANVYFKSMTPKLKVLAGLEPHLKGAGSDWFVPPEEILGGRAVLHPVKKECLDKLNYIGIDSIALDMIRLHEQQQEIEKNNRLNENDLMWQRHIEITLNDLYNECSLEESQENSNKLKAAFAEFSTLYKSSITKIEGLLINGAVKEIERVRQAAFDQMKNKYWYYLKQQSLNLRDEYDRKLANEYKRIKEEFMNNVEKDRTEMAEKIHDLNVDKDIALASVRHLLESHNLACQVYVALKEKEECRKETEEMMRIHDKTVGRLKEELVKLDLDIEKLKEKEKLREVFSKAWENKVCHVVEKLKIFIKYCLKEVPEQADFFIKLEELMLLQLDEVLKNPTAESSFVEEAEGYQGPTPKPHPFYLCWDKTHKPHFDQELCPAHHTGAAQMPVIVINKRLLYAKCDTLDQFTDKLTHIIHDANADAAFEDRHDYSLNVPVKFDSSQRLLEMELEGPILQVINQELALRREPVKVCPGCKMYNCMCRDSCMPSPSTMLDIPEAETRSHTKTSLTSTTKSFKSSVQGKGMKLVHHREPKAESYLRYIKSQKCNCAKTIKVAVDQALPPYMKKTSPFEAPELLNYEACTWNALQELIIKLNPPPVVPPVVIIPSKTADASTQYSNPEYDEICTCFSVDEIQSLLDERKIIDRHRFSVTNANVETNSPTFLSARRHSLEKDPDLLEIFKRCP